MSGPDTNTGQLGRTEAQKIAEATLAVARDEFQYRLTTLTTLARLEMALDSAVMSLEAHKRDDAYQFGELNKRLGNVTSSVGDFEDTKAQFKGARNFVLGLVAIIAAVGGSILFFIEVIKYLSKP